MIARELITLVKAHTGRVYLTATSGTDAITVQIVKTDLLWKLANRYDLEDETGFEAATNKDGSFLFIDRAY